MTSNDTDFTIGGESNPPVYLLSGASLVLRSTTAATLFAADAVDADEGSAYSPACDACVDILGNGETTLVLMLPASPDASTPLLLHYAGASVASVGEIRVSVPDCQWDSAADFSDATAISWSRASGVSAVARIPLGATVEWEVTDQYAHTVTDASCDGSTLARGCSPRAFRSDSLTRGDTFSHRFLSCGVHWYYCEPHQATMVGQVRTMLLDSSFALLVSDHLVCRQQILVESHEGVALAAQEAPEDIGKYATAHGMCVIYPALSHRALRDFFFCVSSKLSNRALGFGLGVILMRLSFRCPPLRTKAMSCNPSAASCALRVPSMSCVL